MTPPRLVEIRCPECQQRDHWVIDCDFRAAYGAGGKDVGYGERNYYCPHCKVTRTGYAVLQQSPVEFLIDPERMNKADLNHWVTILKHNFPEHPYSKLKPSRWYSEHPLHFFLEPGRTHRLSSLARTLLCIAGGILCGYFGFILAAIFVPLLLPLSLSSAPAMDTYTPLIMLIAMITFAVAGFTLCWKVIARWAERS